jgi:hypothetical protein
MNVSNLNEVIAESGLGKIRSEDIKRLRRTFLIPKNLDDKMEKISENTGLTKTLLVLIGLYLLGKFFEEK